MTFNSCYFQCLHIPAVKMVDSREETREPDDEESGEEWRDPAVRLEELDEASDEKDGGEQQGISMYQIVQAFLVPAVIVGVVVMMFLAIRSLFTTGQSTDQLVSRIEDGSSRDQWVAAAQLGKRLQADGNGARELRSNNNLNTLRRVFSTTRNDQLKIYLSQIFGIIRDGKAASVLEEELKTTTNSAVKVMVLKALGEIESMSSSSVIGDHLDTENAAVRQAAMYAAGQLQDPSHIPLLRKGLSDRIPHVQLNAAIALARFEDLREVPVMRVVETLTNYMNIEQVTARIQNTDYELPAPGNHPMLNKRSSRKALKQRREIDRENHVSRMQASAIRAFRHMLEARSGEMHFLKPKKKRDRILNQIHSELLTITGRKQKTTRPLRAEARKLLSILNNIQDE